MPKKTRRGIEYPKEFMKIMKKQKRRRIRRIPIDKDIVESKHNNADMEI